MIVRVMYPEHVPSHPSTSRLETDPTWLVKNGKYLVHAISCGTGGFSLYLFKSREHEFCVPINGVNVAIVDCSLPPWWCCAMADRPDGERDIVLGPKWLVDRFHDAYFKLLDGNLEEVRLMRLSAERLRLEYDDHEVIA